MIFIFAISIGIIVTFVFIVAGDIPLYYVEIGTTRVYFLSKKRAEKFYNKQKEFYELCAEIDKAQMEIQKELNLIESK